MVIVIDAVDEVQMPAGSGANVLYLPPSLPQGVYFVLTRRPQPVLLETVPGIPLETFTLQADMPENQADLRAYLRWQAAKPELWHHKRKRFRYCCTRRKTRSKTKR